ncbi:MAG: YqaJ viral recombinase family protein [Myxococcaceae bacterium]|nr:YqaJ viral recombinase family protein [Myxococcaceae bacterium]
MSLTPEQKAARKLGGSIIAAALGVSRYKTPLDAYFDIKGETPEYETTEDQDRGIFLEPALLEWSRKKTGIDWLKPSMPLVSRRSPWFTYSPDGIPAHGGNAILEIKAPGPFAAAEWGDEGTDQVPMEYLLQGAWGVMVTDTAECHFAALISGKLRLFKYVRDLELEERMVAKAQAFIANHVEPSVPPEPTYADFDHLSRMFPKHVKGKRLRWNDVDEAHQQIIADYLRLKVVAAQAKKELDSKEALIQFYMRDIESIYDLPPDLGFQRIDWKTNAPALHAGSWKSIAEELLAAKTTEEQEAIKARFMPPTGSRVFRAWENSKKRKP